MQHSIDKVQTFWVTGLIKAYHLILNEVLVRLVVVDTMDQYIYNLSNVLVDNFVLASPVILKLREKLRSELWEIFMSF